MATKSNLHVLILAGGLGKRMKSTLPKVLHKLLDKPMLVRVIETAKTLHPTNIYIVVGKYEPIIRETLSQYMSLNNIIFVKQMDAQGTGHAVQCALPELSKLERKDKVLILSGDVPLLKEDSMRSLITKDPVTLLTTKYDDPTGYGRIVTNSANQFIKIVEQKDCDDHQKNIQIINAGVYAFEIGLLSDHLPKLNNNNSQQEYYLTDIFEIILRDDQAVIDAIELPKHKSVELVGVNTKEQLEELETKLK